ncbi:MAG TPA: PQQ-binding-like beta-propeller repeat protein [Ktedonobacteraceae bacterium]
MNIPDPEHAAGGETEVEITDLDSGQIPGRSTRRNRVPWFRARAWMSLAMIGGIALLVVVVLVSVLHLPKVARVTSPVPINYPVSLFVVDGICYTTAPNGVVTALRASDGVLLWRHVSGKTGEESATVVDGVIYLVPFIPPDSTATTVTVEALRASNGSPLWSRTLPRDSFTFFQLTVVNRVVYVLSEADTIEALRASDGALLWSYTSRMLSVLTVADGVVYGGTKDGHLSALRASDGFPLWTYTSLTPQSFSPVVADGRVFLNLQGGGMDVLRAGTGGLLWRYTPPVPALQLFPLPLVTNGVVYAATQDGHLYALRASNGSTVWRIALHATDLLLLSETGGVIYVGTNDSSIVALRESSGSVLWRHQGGEEEQALITEGVIYLTFYIASNSIGSITVLRASDGIVLWRYIPPVPARQLSPVEADGLVLIASQDGSIDALRASSGSLLWHRAMNS